MKRRAFLRASAGMAAATFLPSCRGAENPAWSGAAYRKAPRSRVAVLEAMSYGDDLRRTLLQGLRLFDLPVLDRRVLLKPNFVEYDPREAINTHPVLIGAAIEAFRELGAREVLVGEGPGHRRDTEYLIEASGLAEMLAETGSRYIDLNQDPVRAVELPARYTGLERLHLPSIALDVDLVVSMPKLKTHHWAGVTLSLKNMFGIVPGSVYGWPKNLLHWRGIGYSILDINAALTVPRFNIVDGIVGMEGNGPIQGDPRPTGVLVLGADPVAVDATASRLMGIDPMRIGYLAEAATFLGNAEGETIEQIGEDPGRLQQDYRVLEHFRGISVTSAG